MLDNIRNRFKGVTRTSVQPVQLQQLQTELLAESTPDLSYLVLIVGSCALAKRLRRRFATFGLLSNSAAVIIGAMIIAPLMLPIRGLAFGALQGNVTLFRKGLMAVAIGTLLAVAKLQLRKRITFNFILTLPSFRQLQINR